MHLDTDYLIAPDEFVGLAPMSVLCERLCSVVNPGIEALDDPFMGGVGGGCRGSDAVVGRGAGAWTAETARKILFYFHEFVSELLQVCWGE